MRGDKKPRKKRIGADEEPSKKQKKEEETIVVKYQGVKIDCYKLVDLEGHFWGYFTDEGVEFAQLQLEEFSKCVEFKVTLMESFNRERQELQANLKGQLEVAKKELEVGNTFMSGQCEELKSKASQLEHEYFELNNVNALIRTQRDGLSERLTAQEKVCGDLKLKLKDQEKANELLVLRLKEQVRINKELAATGIEHMNQISADWKKMMKEEDERNCEVINID